MHKETVIKKLKDLFVGPVEISNNFIELQKDTDFKNQSQTNEVFSEKWEFIKSDNHIAQLEKFQKEWFLNLYGFKDEKHLSEVLNEYDLIFDAGCGLGYKSAWFAILAPESIVVGMDYSGAAKLASTKYAHLSNLYFIQGDIANTHFKASSIGFTVCDQVIMHTEDPNKTFQHLGEITGKSGQFCCYVYRKKALPRELVDSYFRDEVHDIGKEEIWELSKQLTVLGKNLSELNVKIESPEIPLLGIKKGEYDIQRFIYWNFLKCFWKPDWSDELNVSTNFDWYSPSNAKRFSENEFRDLIRMNNLKIVKFHEEDACYSGRFKKE